MKNGSNRPFEEEFRSSQVYKTLSGSGSFVADKIAEGLGKAAEEIDTALSGMASNANPKRQQPRGYYQNYTQGPAGPQKAPPQNSPARNTPPSQGRDTSYRYQYQYQYRPRGTQPVQAPPPVYRPPQPQNAAHRPAGVTPVPAPQMKLVRGPNRAKYYVTAVTALLYALNMPMYKPAHFAVFAIVEAAVFLLSSLIFKGKKKFVPIEEEKPRKQPVQQPEEEAKPSKTGNPEVDKIIDEGNEYLKKLRAANDAIPDEALSDCIERMEKASAGIFEYISQNPSKAPQIRKFMSYYLPTTLKLLNSYQRLAKQSVKGETITSTMFNIAGMMHTVADAFEKQLDSLFSDEAMDISADITVFETLLKQEGFVGDKKEGQLGK